MAGENLSLDLVGSANLLLRQSIQDRVVGCIFGSALGDAIGSYTEFLRHTQAVKVYPARNFSLDDSQKMGYVYRALGSGLFLLRRVLDQLESAEHPISLQMRLFEENITQLIMCGGGADTNACFAGALLGSYLGYRCLPTKWSERLRHANWLMGKAEDLFRRISISNHEYDHNKHVDTAADGGKGLLTDSQLERRNQEFVPKLVMRQENLKREQEEADKAQKPRG